MRSSGSVLLPEFLPPELLKEDTDDFDTVAIDGTDWQGLPALVEKWLAEGESDLYRRALEHFDRYLISRTLNHSEGNQGRASEVLGLSRVTLRAKLRAIGLAVEKHVSPQNVNVAASQKS